VKRREEVDSSAAAENWYSCYYWHGKFYIERVWGDLAEEGTVWHGKRIQIMRKEQSAMEWGFE